MTGSVSIDFSISNLWLSWQRFEKGKTRNEEFLVFEYDLLNNLLLLQNDLETGNYQHGDYKKFTVNDSKKREVSVATVRDRIVHRLVYDYLVAVYDKPFIYDAWSCRKNKGVIAAIERAQSFALKNKDGYFYRGDIRKFFDNVDHSVLLRIIDRKISGEKARRIIKAIVKSYRIPGLKPQSRTTEQNDCAKAGIPIGNLTSQIFANIYLNELDIFAKRELKIKHYLRYGDDILIFGSNINAVRENSAIIVRFIKNNLMMSVNNKNKYLGQVKQGIKFCGVNIFARGRRLNKRMRGRVFERLNFLNIASYKALLFWHDRKLLTIMNWCLLLYQKKTKNIRMRSGCFVLACGF